MTSSSVNNASSSRPKRAVRLRRMAQTAVQQEREHQEEDEEEGEASAFDDGSADEVPLIEMLLPGHKVARGRGRRKQLEQMSEEEKRAEKQARMMKMRVSARECRKRKKAGIQGLEAKLQKFVQKDKRNLRTIRTLQDELQALRESLQAVRAASGAFCSGGASSPPAPTPFPSAAEGTFQNHIVPQQEESEMDLKLEIDTRPASCQFARREQQPGRTAMRVKEENMTPLPERFEPIAEDGPYETLSSILAAPPHRHQSLHEKRFGAAPTVLDFSNLGAASRANCGGGEADVFRLPTPQTPLTPQLRVEMERYRLLSPLALDEDDLMPGFALPTPELATLGDGGHNRRNHQDKLFSFGEVQSVLLG
jgi:hypothetical protein